MASETAGGYMGKILRVDLSREQISEESLDNETLRKYVGGAGLGAKYLNEEVPPGVEWSDPENRLMFFTGPLSGTNLSGAGIISVVSKGPKTNMAGSSQANGYFAAFLKFAGYDGVIVQGKANRWLYLHVHDGTAELHDAQQLVGKDTWATEDAIKEGLRRQSSVYSIGPAGENLVHFAGILGDKGHSASHNGLGAVMGSKKLKAIVAERGRRAVPIANAAEQSKGAKTLNANAKKASEMMGKWGTMMGYPMLHKGGQLPVKNYTTSVFDAVDKFNAQYLRETFKATPTTCWACRIAHCRITEVTEGPYKGYIGEEPEYEGMAAMSAAIGQTDVGATVMLGDTIDKLGMDINESGYIIGWLMECYEKGLIKKDLYDGIEMNWGNAESTLEMLKRIASRQGNANIWADGVKKAAEKIGGEAQECAIYTEKGASPRGHDHRARWGEMIDTCMSNTGTVEVGPGIPVMKELGQEPVQDPFDAMEVSTMNAKTNGRRLFEDSLALCFFCNSDMSLAVDLLNATTGWEFDVQEAMDVGKRIVNTLRVFGFRHGLTKEMEVPSKRYGSTPIDGPAEGRAIMPQWEALRSNYYKTMGWDPETGKPLPETLEKLGLANLIPYLK
ncbi:aldehyde ferredoxin oxidoreductase family protein [Chloroflexota bacterium]